MSEDTDAVGARRAKGSVHCCSSCKDLNHMADGAHQLISAPTFAGSYSHFSASWLIKLAHCECRMLRISNLMQTSPSR